MAYQFGHWATFSRKGTGGSDRSSQDPSARHRGLTAVQVCGEAARHDGDCPHVDHPLPPTVLYGVEPMEALAEHDRLVTQQTAACKGRGRGQGIRLDTHTLSGIVLSHPTPTADLASEEARQEYQSWRSDAVVWLEAEAARQGLVLLSIVEHLDEGHPHLHALAVADPDTNPRMDVKLCHPGHKAQKAHEGPRASIAYKEAMREWQNRLYSELSAKHGQLRLGPGRRRLPQNVYQREKQQAQAIAEAMTAAQADREAAARLLTEAQAMAAAQVAAHDAIALERAGIALERDTLAATRKQLSSMREKIIAAHTWILEQTAFIRERLGLAETFVEATRVISSTTDFQIEFTNGEPDDIARVQLEMEHYAHQLEINNPTSDLPAP